MSAVPRKRRRRRWLYQGSPFLIVWFTLMVAFDLANDLLYWSAIMALILGINIGTHLSDRWSKP